MAAENDYHWWISAHLQGMMGFGDSSISGGNPMVNGTGLDGYRENSLYSIGLKSGSLYSSEKIPCNMIPARCFCPLLQSHTLIQWFQFQFPSVILQKT